MFREGSIRDDDTGPAAGETILELRSLQQRRCRNGDGPELHRRQHGLPQCDHVAQHDEHAITRNHPLRREEVGDLIGTARHRGIGENLIVARIIHHPQRRPVVTRRDPIEVIGCPIEFADCRPLKGLERLRVGHPLAQEPVP